MGRLGVGNVALGFLGVRGREKSEGDKTAEEVFHGRHFN
jgi:hypothetical protein